MGREDPLLDSLGFLLLKIVVFFLGTCLTILYHWENGGRVPLGWRAPSCLTPPVGALSKGYIPNKNPLYTVYMGLIIKGTIPRAQPFSHVFPMIVKS